MNMNDFLAVDENGFKLATKAAFWRGATPEMWAVPHLEVKNYLLANGWNMEEASRAINARYQLLPENRAKKAKTNKKYRATKQMSERNQRSDGDFLILAGDEAKTRAFWHACTPEQRDVNFVYLRWLMTDRGYSEEDIKIIQQVRERVKMLEHLREVYRQKKKNSTNHSDGDFLILAGEAAKTRAFWHACTPEQRNVNFAYLRWLMTDMGYSEADIDVIRSAREQAKVLERQRELRHKKKKISNTH